MREFPPIAYDNHYGSVPKRHPLRRQRWRDEVLIVCDRWDHLGNWRLMTMPVGTYRRFKTKGQWRWRGRARARSPLASGRRNAGERSDHSHPSCQPTQSLSGSVLQTFSKVWHDGSLLDTADLDMEEVMG